MSLALVLDGAPSELTGPNVTLGDVMTALASVMLWTEDERNAAGVYTIQESSIPEGKISTGSSLSFDGAAVTRVHTLDDVPLAHAQAARVAEVLDIRSTKLAAGFDYDFQDARGVHHIATAPDDMAKWDEVTTIANARINKSDTTAIAIVTDTGACTVTPAEWQDVLLAAADFRQPIYQQSFVLQAEIAAAADYAAVQAIDVNAGWPE